MTNTTTRPGAVQRQDEQTAKTRTVIAYTRVADRTRQGSIQAQRDDLDAEIAFHGWTVKEWIDDLGQPGTTLERPGLTRALELLAHRQADALVVCEAARLSRSAAVTRQLAAHAAAYGWQLIIVSDDRQLPLFPTEATPGT
jgi:DNA invertase Pin-like site-specific DNA recombinase